MRWIVLDGVLVLLALVVLAGLAVTLWRRANALGREINRVRTRIGQATAGLQQAAAPLDRRSSRAS
ncbi:MAG: hypothetical protein ABJC62_07195 [Frankiaceae bacterium]|jgi:type II secretory pathway component PulJ